MRSALSVFILILTFFGGCSTTSLNQTPRLIQMLPPPIVAEEQKSQAELKEEQLRAALTDKSLPTLKWWTEYQVGRLWIKENPQRSCDAFLKVGAEVSFPLRRVAQIRALEVCPVLTEFNYDEITQNPKEPWLNKLALKVVLARAVRLKQTKDEMRFSLALAQVPGTLQSERVQLLSRTLELAKENSSDPAAATLQTEALESLYATAPRLQPSPSEKNWLLVASDFRQARQFEKAREYYQKIIQSDLFSPFDKYKALEGIRLSYKLQKQTDDYIAATRKLAEFTKKLFLKPATSAAWLERYHDSQLLLARTLWTEDKTAEARSVVANLQRNIRGRYPLGESQWLLARIAEEAGHFDQAVQILANLNIPQIPSKDLQDKIRWYQAWNLRRLKRWDQAIAAMNAALKIDSSAFAQARIHYWLGRTYADSGQTEKASSEYQQLFQNDELGYYGLLAARELHQTYSPLESEKSQNREQYRTIKAFNSSEEASYFEWTIALGEEPIGADFLDFVMSSYHQKGNINTDQYRDLLRMYPRVGGYKSLFAQLNALAPSTRNEILKQFPGLLFPQPFQDIVEKAAQKFSVEKELLYSIMRQESSFDPYARSGADAFGLLQVIPEVAKSLASQTETHYQNPEDLFDPEINIPTGAAFLRSLEDRHNNQFIVVVSSYNASEKAIAGWLKTRSRKDPLEFIEDIPFEETRAYVRLVLRNYIFYKRFNSGGRPVSFPETCLQISQPTNL
jgi:soluble lytic murein transglycosylase